MRKAKKNETLISAAELAALQAKTKTRISSLLTRKAAEKANIEALDTRSAARKEVGHTAVVYLDATQTIDCVIADMSATGLRLLFREPTYLPETAIVDCPGLGGLIVVEARWQAGLETGAAIDRQWTKKVRTAAAENDAE